MPPRYQEFTVNPHNLDMGERRTDRRWGDERVDRQRDHSSRTKECLEIKAPYEKNLIHNKASR